MLDHETAQEPSTFTMFQVRVLLVDDHDFFRRSILFPLETEPTIEVVGTATSGDQAIPLCRSLRPDVVLMDLNMPYLSGLAAIERIAPQERAPAILVLTGADDGESVRRAFAAGAHGYLRKDMITDELLISAIFTVASGGVFVDPKTFALLKIGLLNHQPRFAEDQQRLAQLLPEDRTLLCFVALGYENEQIGQELQVTPKTISNRLSQLYLRLGISNRVQAATFALRSGLVTLETV